MIKFRAIPETEMVSLSSEEEGKGLIAKLRSRAAPPITCPHCGGERIRNGTRLVTFRDIPTDCQPMRIEWTRQNFRCPKCFRSSHDNHPAFDQRHAVTRRFVEWVASEGRNVTFMSLSKQSGVNEKVIRQIFTETEKPIIEPTRIENLGIELIKVAGSLYPALIDISNEVVVDVFSSVDELAISQLGDNAVQSTSTVVRDFDIPGGLAATFSAVAEHLVSRSSLHRVALSAFEVQVRDLVKKLPRGEKQSSAPDVALFRKRNSGLGHLAGRRLEWWQKNSAPLHVAYFLKEHFLNMWTFSRNPSESQWEDWKERVSNGGLDLAVLIERIESMWMEISGYTLHREFREKYPAKLSEAQTINKAATHSFSASRAILLANQTKIT